MAEVWPVVRVLDGARKRSVEDLSKVFSFPNTGLPFGLSGFAGSKILIDGSLRPNANSYLHLATNYATIAYVDRNQALTSSGASEMFSYDIIPFEYIVPSGVSDQLSISGNGVYFVMVKSLGTAGNLLDWTQTRFNPRADIQDTQSWTTGSTYPVVAYNLDLGSVKTVLLYTIYGLWTSGGPYYSYAGVDYSTDGNVWGTIDQFQTTSQSEVTRVVSAKVTARYFRWWFCASGSSYPANLRVRKVWCIG